MTLKWARMVAMFSWFRAGLSTRVGRQKVAPLAWVDFLFAPAIVGSRLFGYSGIAGRATPIELFLAVELLTDFIPVRGTVHMDDTPADIARPNGRLPSDFVSADGAFVVVVCNILLDTFPQVIRSRFWHVDLGLFPLSTRSYSLLCLRNRVSSSGL